MSLSLSLPSTELQNVANYFIAQAHANKKVISNKKLQKLVYYAQAWHLVFTNNPLFNDPIEAWIHGPAIRTLYNQYKDYWYYGITEEPNKPTFDGNTQQVLDDVWSVYGKYDADYLETLTHTEQPWLVTRNNAEADERTTAVIEPNLMKIFYRKRLESVRQKRSTEA